MTCGAAASLTISLKAIINEGDEVIVFAPFFTEYRVFVKNAGGNLIISNPNYDNFQIDFDDFESKITDKTSAIIINSPNNPSGVVYSEETIIKLSNILNKYEKKFNKQIYLISDEPYRELVYNDIKVPYIMNYYDNSIVCYSYSKVSPSSFMHQNGMSFSLQNGSILQALSNPLATKCIGTNRFTLNRSIN